MATQFEKYQNNSILVAYITNDAELQVKSMNFLIVKYTNQDRQSTRKH